MSSDLPTQLVSTRLDATRQLAQYAVLRKRHQMDMALADMIGDVMKNAPRPAATSHTVDKTA